MAKKGKDVDLDDFDFDDFDDFDNFDDVSIDGPKKDRNPVIETGKEVLKGAAEGLTSESFLREFTRAAMPPGYSEALDLVSDTKRRAGSLYNEARTKLQPAVKDAKRAVNAMLPAAEKVLPKRLIDRLREATTEDKQGSRYDPNENEITSTLANIFESQVQLSEADKQRQVAEDVIKDRRESRRHETNLQVWEDIRNATARMVGYQDKVLSQFQRKSLELQYRQYFVLRDTLALHQSATKGSIEELKKITKNTALPEYVKVQGSEAFKQAMRDRLVGRFADTMAEYSRGFRDRLFDNVGKMVKSNVDAFGNAASMAAMGADGIQQMNDMAEMGMSRSGMAGNMAGNAIGQWAGIRLGRKLRPSLMGNEKLVARGADLLYKVRNMPHMLNEWKNTPTDFMSKWGFLSDFAKSLIPGYRGPGAEVPNEGTNDLYQPASINNQFLKSVNEIIPGFLSRIYQSVEGIRTGEMPDRQVYNFERNEFTSFKRSVGDIKRRLIQPQELEYLKLNVDRMVEKIDKDGSLSAEARKALGEQLTKDVYSGKRFDPSRLSTTGGWVSSIDAGARDELRDYFKQRYGLDSDGKMNTRDATTTTRLADDDQSYQSIINGMPNPFSRINAFANSGQREQLRALGLLSRVGLADTVDGSWMDGIFDADRKGTLDYDGVEWDRPGDTRKPGRGKGNRSSKLELAAVRLLAEELKKLREQGISGGGPNGQNGPNPAGHGAHGAGAAGFGAASTGSSQAAQDAANERRAQWERVISTLDNGTDRTVSEIVQLREALMHASGGTNQLLVKAIEGLSAIAELIPSAGSDISRDRRGAHQRSIGQLLGDGLSGLIDGGLWLGGKGLGAVGRGAVRSGKAAWWLAGKAAQIPLMLGSGMVNFAKKVSGFNAKDWLKNKKDAVKGVMTVLSADGRVLLDKTKMAAGEYYDAVTGKPIKAIQDIAGDVKDAAGKIVFTMDDYRKQAMTEDGRRLILTNARNWAHGIDNKVRVTKTYKRLRAIWNWDADQIVDVYIRDKPGVPVMTAADIRAGKYRDAKKGHPIESVGDIEGAVVDWDGNMVLTEAQWADGLYDANGKKLNRNVLSRGFGAITGLIGNAGKVVELALKPGIWAMKVGKKALGRSFVPFDVYVKGETSPRLLARLILSGAYLCTTTGKTVNSYSDIEGPVTDRNGNELLAAKDIPNLVDRFGRKLEGLPKRLVKLGLEATAKGIRALWKGGEWAAGKVRKGAKAIGDGIVGIGRYFTQAWVGNVEELKKNNSTLERIYDLLDERLPGGSAGRRRRRKGKKGPMGSERVDQNGNPVATHDKDGDGDRDGSWQDILANKAKSAKDKIKGALDGFKKPEGKSLKGLLGMLGSGIMGLISAITTFNPLKFLGKIPGLGKLGAAAAAAWGGLKRLGGGVLGRAGGGLLGAAGRAVGFVGRQVVWRAVTWAAFGLASVVSAPVAIGAAAVGGGYLLYKYLSKESKLTQLRMLQYGLDPDDGDQVDPVAKLEDIYGQHMTVNRKGDVEMNGDPEMKAMLEPFGIDHQNESDSQRFATWIVWFRDRFKPIYAKHRSELAKRVPEAALPDVDKVIKPEYKLPFARGTMLATEPSPYNITQSPFGEDPLPHGTDKIQAMISEIEKEFGRKEFKTEQGNIKPALQGLKLPDRAAGLSESGRRALAIAKSEQYLTEDEIKKKQEEFKKTGAGKIAWATLPVTRIDEVTSLRYRVYGMSVLYVSHTNALMAFEKDLFDLLDYGSGKAATFNGDQIAVYEKYATTFNRMAGNEADRVQWLYWFNNRFFPVFLAYASMIRQFGTYKSVGEAWKSLKPTQRLQVAEGLANVTVKINDEEVSVWKVEVSPFPDVPPNTNPDSVKDILAGLRKDVLDKKVEEAFKTDAQKKAEASSKRKDPMIAPGTGPLMPTGNAVREMGLLEGLNSGLATVSSGEPVRAAMAGSGGRASDIKKPGAAASGSVNDRWNAMKDVIVDAARMTGMDPALLATFAGIESNMNPNAGAKTSSAKGLFQFTKGTWSDMLKMHGARYGLGMDADVFDPVANALMGAEFLKMNMNTFRQRMGREPTERDLYMMHFLGSEGGIRFFKTPMTAAASEGASSSALAANKPIFYTQSGNLRSVAEVYQEIDRRLANNGHPYGRLASTYLGTGKTPKAPTLDRPADPEPAVSATPTSVMAGLSTNGGGLAIPGAPSTATPQPDNRPVGIGVFETSAFDTSVATPRAPVPVTGVPGSAIPDAVVGGSPKVNLSVAASMPVAAPSPVVSKPNSSQHEREKAIREAERREQRRQQSVAAQETELSRLSAEQAKVVEGVLKQQLDTQVSMNSKLEDILKELKGHSSLLRDGSKQSIADQREKPKPERPVRDANPRPAVVDMRSR